MSSLRPALALLSCVVAAALVSGCSTEGVEKRQDKRTDSYENYQEKRAIRSGARQERSDAWFNRVMGNPVKSDDTGLKLPPQG